MESNKENKMEYVFLGNTGMMVPKLTFGTLTFQKPEQFDTYYECFKKAWDLGMNAFDTAEQYGQKGTSEILLGKCIKKLDCKREDIIIMTKIFHGADRNEPMAFNSTGLSRKHVIEGLRNSLKRLQLDYVDVVLAHRCDLHTPMEEICRAFDWCIRHGLCLYWGTSNWNAYQIEQALGICDKLNLHTPKTEQAQYNMFNREDMEVNYQSLFKEYNYGGTGYSPLAMGMLTGKYLDGIPKDSRVATTSWGKGGIYDKYLGGDKKEKTVKQLKGLQVIAEELNCSMAALAMAWVLAYDKVQSAIVGASKVKYFDDFVIALEIKDKLTKEVMEKIENALDNRPKPDFDCRVWKDNPHDR